MPVIQGFVRLHHTGIVRLTLKFLDYCDSNFSYSVSTLLALLLDVLIFRRATARGKYNPMLDPDAVVRRGLPRLSYRDNKIEMGNFSTQLREDDPSQRGYVVPEEQFEYDTGYHGGHAERVLS